MALSAKAEAREQGGFTEIVADPIEIDAGRRGTAATPQTMKATVTAFGDQPRRAKTQVARGDTRRM